MILKPGKVLIFALIPLMLAGCASPPRFEVRPSNSPKPSPSVSLAPIPTQAATAPVISKIVVSAQEITVLFKVPVGSQESILFSSDPRVAKEALDKIFGTSGVEVHVKGNETCKSDITEYKWDNFMMVTRDTPTPGAGYDYSVVVTQASTLVPSPQIESVNKVRVGLSKDDLTPLVSGAHINEYTDPTNNITYGSVILDRTLGAVNDEALAGEYAVIGSLQNDTLVSLAGPLPIYGDC